MICCSYEILLFYYYLSLESFSHQCLLTLFHKSLSDSKYPQVSRTLLSILAVLNIAVVWMVPTRPPTSKSYSPFNNTLVTVPKAPITIDIIVTFMFHGLFMVFLSILALIWLVLMALFCAAIRRHSVSLLKFPFLDYVQVSSCEMLSISRLKRP